jgi:hypothetical protein
MDIETRIRIIEDRDAISRLKAEYCDAVDGGWASITHDGDRVAPLFVAGGVWMANGVGEAKGHDEIRALMKPLQEFHYAFHCITNPSILIDGDRAEATWHFFVFLTHREQGKMVSGGIYQDEFTRTENGWRFQRLFANLSFYGPANEGWDDISRQIGFHPKAY